MRIYKSVSELTGRTPLMELRNIEDENRLCARVLRCLRCSIRQALQSDRVAKAMLDDARRRDRLRRHDNRAYKRKHRHRPCRHRRVTRLQSHHSNALTA